MIWNLILYCFLTCYPDSGSDQFLVWEETIPLQWSDFQGAPDNQSPFDALTRGTIKYEYKPVGGRNMIMEISVIFEKDKSWVKPKKKIDFLLKHEQVHFDIYELYARKIVMELMEANVLSHKDFGDKTQMIFQTAFDEMLRFQQEYDHETKHSNLPEKQILWNKKIEDLLKEYEAYSTKEIKFRI